MIERSYDANHKGAGQGPDTLMATSDIVELVKELSRKPAQPAFLSPRMLKNRFLISLSLDQRRLEASKPHYQENPYLAAFFIARQATFSLPTSPCEIDRMKRERLFYDQALQKFRRKIKALTSEDWFKIRITTLQKAKLNREQSVSYLIDGIFRSHARVLAIRIDLYLIPSFRNLLLPKDQLEVMQHFWAALRRDIYTANFAPPNLGFICALEYGHQAGFHFHLLVFFDGSKHQQDINLAKLIGNHWKQKITKGFGWYHNCNAKKAKYKKLGIGKIDYWDSEKLENLKSAANYLAKIDYYIVSHRGESRTFFRSNIPKPIAKSGRPRRKLPPPLITHENQ